MGSEDTSQEDQDRDGDRDRNDDQHGGTSLAERIQYHSAVREAFAPAGIGICAWAYTNTFPFWDRANGRWLPGLRAAFGLPESR